MGLENLENIFQHRRSRYPDWNHNIEDNEANRYDGLPMESIGNRMYDHTFSSNGTYEDVIEISSIQNKQSPSPLMAISGLAGDVIVNGHSANTIRINYQGGMSQTIKDISSYMEKYESDKGRGKMVFIFKK